MIQDKILKIIKGLNTFSQDDLVIMADIDEFDAEEVLAELVENSVITKVSDDKFKFIEKIRKIKRPQVQKGKIGFITASQNFMLISEQKCTPSTFKSYKSTLNKHLIPFFKNFRISDIKPENIDEFIEVKIGESLSNKSIDNIVKLLGSIFEKALKDRYIQFNPARAVKRFGKNCY